MGKSSACFRLITCGGDPSEKDDPHQVISENNSNDKRGWSFRKKSARHRVLSNTAITETPSSVNKESSFQSLTESSVVEKVYTTNFPDEKPQLSNLASSEMPETVVTETESKVDVLLPESVVTIIQAAIRGFLAQRALLKSKNVVKLQAVVRGHLVRRHAVGTLRCVQAIVKMQLLVRARNAKLSHSENHFNHKDGKNDCSKTLGNEHHVSDVTKSNEAHTSIEKLLNNRFASQLLESTPKNKPIRIKCDPSKADSAWKWLERWMSVSSKDSVGQNPVCMSEQSDKAKDSTYITQLGKGIPSEVIADSPLPSKDEEKTTTYDANNFNVEASPSTSFLVKDNLEQAPTEKTITDDAKVTSTEIDPFQIEKMEPEEEKMTMHDIDDFNFQESLSTSLVKDNFEQAPTEKTITDDAKVTSTEIDPFQIEKMESEEEKKMTMHDTNDFNFQESLSTSLVKDNFKQAPTVKEITDDAKVNSTGIDSFQNEIMESEEEKKVMYDVSNNFQESPSTSSLVKDNLAQVPTKNVIPYDAEVSLTEIDSFQNVKMELESPASIQHEPSSLPQKPKIDDEQHKQSIEAFASDQLKTEGKKPVHGSQKFSNPAFDAAQSKFEELSLMENLGRSNSLSNQDAPVQSLEKSAPYPSRIGGSECGTELSISSTTDLPNRSEVVIVGSEHDAKDLAEGIGKPENKTDNDEAKTVCATPASSLPNSDLNQIEIVHGINDNMVPSVNPGDSKEPAIEPEEDASELLREKTETVLQDPKLSPEASPRSHMTIPESQGTPSSQVSVNTKDSKVSKTGSSNRRRTLSAGNKSPASATHDSGSRGSREQLPKDQLSGKRRKSFGSVKSDHVDQEPRDNSSNNSPVPHFMQATESARAKINANNSPRSSPDVHDQDIPTKKRHSLAGAAGRQGSPRVQRSTSHAQQGTKGNGVHVLHERKWQR